jgi:hypothetical protein
MTDRGPNQRTSQPPADLAERYLELGLKGCAEHYRAWNRTVRRWLEQVGREQLRAQRMARLMQQRTIDAERRRQSRSTPYAKRMALRQAEARRRRVCSAEPMPPAEVISAAAHFLRTPCGGRNVVCPSGHGDWFIGTVRVTAQDLLRRAKAKGFVE